MAGRDGLEIRVRSEIPPGRGLGSSAALAVAAAAAAGSNDPLAVAADSDGHGENAAASVMGGLVAATMVDGQPICRRLGFDTSIGIVVVVPDFELLTSQARAVLPATVAFEDAVFNLGRLSILLAGLADVSMLTPEAGDDRLHQQARGALFPESRELLARLREAGAIVSCWSGAGPSLLGICADRTVARNVRDAGELAMSECDVPGRCLELEVDVAGLVVS